jgi:hypothetical protein
MALRRSRTVPTWLAVVGLAWLALPTWSQWRPRDTEMIWMHSLREGKRAAVSPRQLSGRGLSFWSDGKGDDRVIYVTTGYRLVELNARNGQVIQTFGKDGLVDLKVGMHIGTDQQIDLDEWLLRRRRSGYENAGRRRRYATHVSHASPRGGDEGSRQSHRQGGRRGLDAGARQRLSHDLYVAG